MAVDFSFKSYGHDRRKPDLDAALTSLVNVSKNGKDTQRKSNVDLKLSVKASMSDQNFVVFTSAQNSQNATLQSETDTLRAKYGVLKADEPSQANGPDLVEPVIGPALPPNFEKKNATTPLRALVSPLKADHSRVAPAAPRKSNTLWDCSQGLVGWPDDGVPKPTTRIDVNVPIYVTWPETLPHQKRIERVAHDQCGFNNFGNTCFLNSVLQVLGHTLPLVIHCMSQNVSDCAACKNCAQRAGMCLLCMFNAMLRRAGDAKNQNQHSVSPGIILKKVRLFMKSYQQGRQEDAHEFLRCFLQAMENDRMLPYAGRKLDRFSSETNIISRIFGGFWLNTMVCLSCLHQSRCFDPFWDIAVDVKRSTGLEEALAALTRKEHLAGANAWKCDKLVVGSPM